LAYNFCPIVTKRIFFQRKIYSSGRYFGGILIFCPRKKLGLIQRKKYSAKK
jgi:hypothetical protein